MSGRLLRQEQEQVTNPQSEIEQSHIKREMSDIPGNPQNLQIMFLGESQVLLKWKSPETDGGSPIIKYFVEVLDKHGVWKEEKELPNNKELAFIRDLEPECVYQFRVFAVNEIGVGEPSFTTAFTVPNYILKRKRYPTKIHHAALEIIEVKVGEPLEFQRFVKAEPTTVSWEVNGRPIQNGARVKTTYEKCYTRIEVYKCEKNDSGIYSIRAVNEYGQEEQKLFKLVVNGPPKIHHAALEKIEVKVGELLEFQRFVEAESAAVVSWKLDGKLIGNGDRVESTYDGLFAKIKIPECEGKDNGTYSITAINEYGQVEQELFELVVNGPPKIDLASVETIKVKVGESLEFQTLVDAEPEAVVSWKVDGELIENGDKVELTFDGVNAKIKIPVCIENNSGMYSIMAINEFGIIEQKSFELVVIDGIKEKLKKLGKAAAYTAGASAVVLGGIAVAVPAMGFTAGGVAACSLAAMYQSAALGGAIASESVFATLQSIGAAGLAASSQAGVVGAAGASSLFAVFRK